MLLIIVLLSVLGIGILFSVLWKVFRIISILMTIVFIIALILSFFLYRDAQDFQEQWPGSEKLLIFHHENNVYGAVASKFSEEDQPRILNGTELLQVKQSMRTQNLDPLTQKYFKVLLLDTDAFSTVNQLPLNDGANLTRDEVFSLLNDDQRLVELAADIDETDPSTLKSMLLVGMLAEAMKNDPLFIVHGLSQGTILLRPESALTYAIDALSSSQIEKIIKTEPLEET